MATSGVSDLPPMPSHAGATSPFCLSCSMTRIAVLIGTAKPRPSLPPLWVAICSLMPMTSPRPLMRGPPELPGLIAASVWMAFGMTAPVGASMLRSTAETIPAVIEKS